MSDPPLPPEHEALATILRRYLDNDYQPTDDYRPIYLDVGIDTFVPWLHEALVQAGWLPPEQQNNVRSPDGG